VVWSWGGGT